MKKKLAEVCQNIGRKIPHWTQGSGGNVSVKEGNVLTIKSSGVRLEDVREDRGLATLDLAEVRKKIQSITGDGLPSEELYSQALRSNEKPSMETGMHVFLPKKWVFHFHSLPALLMAHEFVSRKDKMKTWLKGRAFAPVEFIEPIRPGLLLSRRIKQNPAATFYILENHGVLIQGDEDHILKEWEKFESDFCEAWGYERLLDPALPNGPAPFRLYFPDSAVFRSRMMAILDPSTEKYREPRFVLKSGARELDRDVAEVWQATEALFAVCPTLKELPGEIAQTVGTLPTELFRKAQR